MIILRLVFVYILIFFSITSSCQLTNGEHERILKLKASMSGKDNCKTKIKRDKKGTVFLLFYNFIHDSLSVYVDGTLVSKGHVSKDTSKVSSDFTGTVWPVQLLHKRTRVIVKSRNENVEVQVVLKRKFPVYMISLYSGEWTFTARKCFPVSL
jgi:hypothetical protein